MSLTRVRSDGRSEVADTEAANTTFGCRRDDWCILTDDHDGDCNEDREIDPGADLEYSEE